MKFFCSCGGKFSFESSFKLFMVAGRPNGSLWQGAPPFGLY